MGYGFGVVFWDIGAELGLGCRFGIGFWDRVLGLGLRDTGLGLGFGDMGLGSGFWVLGLGLGYGFGVGLHTKICGRRGPHIDFHQKYKVHTVHTWTFQQKI